MKTDFQTKEATGFEYRRSWLDFRKRHLVVEDSGIKIDTGLPHLKSEQFIPGDQIAGFRYGVKWVRGIYCYVALDFHLYLLLRNNKVIPFTYRCYYGIKKEAYHRFYADVINTVWNRIFVSRVKEMLQQLNEGKEIEINKVQINKSGVTIVQSGFISDQKLFIPWEEVGTVDYATYFVVFSKKDKARLNRSYRYLDDWNTMLLNGVLRSVLDNIPPSTADGTGEVMNQSKQDK